MMRGSNKIKLKWAMLILALAITSILIVVAINNVSLVLEN